MTALSLAYQEPDEDVLMAKVTTRAMRSFLQFVTEHGLPFQFIAKRDK